MGTESPRERHRRLKEELARYDSMLLAFSGGVDSSYLAAVARQVMGTKVIAVTAVSPIHSSSEKQAAVEMATAIGIRHIILPSDVLDMAAFAANPADRCYICKKHLFAALREVALQYGMTTLAHGANVDDLDDYRPGHRAAEEMGVVAPLVTAGLRKADIRQLSRAMGLSTWNRPAMACLATRIPYGRPITGVALEMIDKAEQTVLSMGFRMCRVRHHDRIARIEVLPEEIEKLMDQTVRRRLVQDLKGIGYTYVVVDLEGYVTGRSNCEAVAR